MIDKQKAINLSKAIEYQEGSVVSKELLKSKNDNITLFAFDEGQGLNEHNAPFDAFVYIADGEAEITISSNVHLLKAGEIIIMPADQPHSLKATERFKMLLIMIRS